MFENRLMPFCTLTNEIQNHMIISVDVGKAFDEIQCPNMTYQQKKNS